MFWGIQTSGNQSTCVYQHSIILEGFVFEQSIFLVMGPLRSNKLLEFVQRHLVSKFGTKSGKRN